MSTPSTYIPEKEDLPQIYHEIKWLQEEMTKVRKQMIKRPSKFKHLKDLERQLEDHFSSIVRYNTSQKKM